MGAPLVALLHGPTGHSKRCYHEGKGCLLVCCCRGVPLVDLSHDQITCDMQKSVQGLQKLQAQLGDSGSTGGFTMVAAGAYSVQI